MFNTTRGQRNSAVRGQRRPSNRLRRPDWTHLRSTGGIVNMRGFMRTRMFQRDMCQDTIPCWDCKFIAVKLGTTSMEYYLAAR